MHLRKGSGGLATAVGDRSQVPLWHLPDRATCQKKVARRYGKPHADTSVLGTPWRDRMESVRPSHLDYRPATYRKWPAARPCPERTPVAPRFPADLEQPTQTGPQNRGRTCFVRRVATE